MPLRIHMGRYVVAAVLGTLSELCKVHGRMDKLVRNTQGKRDEKGALRVKRIFLNLILLLWLLATILISIPRYRILPNENFLTITFLSKSIMQGLCVITSRNYRVPSSFTRIILIIMAPLCMSFMLLSVTATTAQCSHQLERQL